jgi:hypothetical protein
MADGTTLGGSGARRGNATHVEQSEAGVTA